MFEMPAPSPRTADDKSKVLIFGAGNFGSCLADHLGDSLHEVFMWSRSEEMVKYFNLHRKHPDYLKDHVFPDCVQAIGPDFPTAQMVQSMDVLLFAIPTQGIR
jgi:glycerol-3-phosphate dehydrogenase